MLIVAEGRGYMFIDTFVNGESQLRNLGASSINGWKRIKRSDTHYEVLIVRTEQLSPIDNDNIFLGNIPYYTFDFYLKQPVGSDDTIRKNNIRQIRFRSNNGYNHDILLTQ